MPSLANSGALVNPFGIETKPGVKLIVGDDRFGHVAARAHNPHAGQAAHGSMAALFGYVVTHSYSSSPKGQDQRKARIIERPELSKGTVPERQGYRRIVWRCRLALRRMDRHPAAVAVRFEHRIGHDLCCPTVVKAGASLPPFNNRRHELPHQIVAKHRGRLALGRVAGLPSGLRNSAGTSTGARSWPVRPRRIVLGSCKR